MRFLIKLKHWQLFLIVIVVPATIQICLFLLGFKTNDFSTYFKWVSIYTIPFSIILLRWFWEIGVLLNENLPTAIKLNITVFKFCLLIAFLIIISQGLFIVDKFITYPESGWTKLFLILSMVSLACVLYSANFIARALKTIKSIEWVEQGQSIAFNDYREYFLLLLIFPVGVWFIQPVINALAEGGDLYTHKT